MEQKLRTLIKEAMIEKQHSGNGDRYQTYKNILEKAQKTAKEQLAVVTDDMIVDAAKKEVKQLEETQSYCVGTAKFVEIARCIDYAKALLPKMATPEDIRAFLTENKVEKNMGACMKALKERFGNSLDSKMASEIAKEYTKS